MILILIIIRSLEKKMIWEKVREAHLINETFKIKIDKYA
jgi:hypothetical protein